MDHSVLVRPIRLFSVVALLVPGSMTATQAIAQSGAASAVKPIAEFHQKFQAQSVSQPKLGPAQAPKARAANAQVKALQQNPSASANAGVPSAPVRTIDADGAIVLPHGTNGETIHYPALGSPYVVTSDGKRHNILRTTLDVQALDPATKSTDTTQWLQRHSDALLAAITLVAQGDKRALKENYLKREEKSKPISIYQRIDRRLEDLESLVRP